MNVTMVGAYQVGLAVSLTLREVRETPRPAPREPAARAALAGLPDRAGSAFTLPEADDDVRAFLAVRSVVDFLVSGT